jgi:hypothetical protein
VGGGIVAQYRAAYENGRLADAGTAEFAGHAAHKYAVDLSAVARAEYYLDAQTGAPLGAVVESHDDRGTYRWVEVVESMERLPPTPENLAKLGG